MRDKNILYYLHLKNNRLILQENTKSGLNVEVDVTPVWHFIKNVLLNHWTVEDFKREQNNRLTK